MRSCREVELAPPSLQVLSYWAWHEATQGCPPGVRAAARALGWPVGSLHRWLRALEADGFLTRGADGARLAVLPRPRGWTPPA
jgi:DNA-binding IclR family transcriptional regulator